MASHRAVCIPPNQLSIQQSLQQRTQRDGVFAQILVIGDANSGRSTMIDMLCGNYFGMKQTPSELPMEGNSKTYITQYGRYTFMYLGMQDKDFLMKIGATQAIKGVVVLYDATKTPEEQQEYVNSYINIIELCAGGELPIAIVATKTDLVEQPYEVVPPESYKGMTKYIPSSCKDYIFADVLLFFLRLFSGHEDITVENFGPQKIRPVDMLKKIRMSPVAKPISVTRK